jgi:hypothetical protein
MYEERNKKLIDMYNEQAEQIKKDGSSLVDEAFEAKKEASYKAEIIKIETDRILRENEEALKMQELLKEITYTDSESLVRTLMNLDRDTRYVL